MTEKDYFQVGAKLIGLYCLVLMLPVLLGVLSTVIAIAGYTSDPLGVQHIPLFLSPILMAALGVYLLKSRAFSHPLCSEETDGVCPTRNWPNISLWARSCTGFFSLWGQFPNF